MQMLTFSIKLITSDDICNFYKSPQHGKYLSFNNLSMVFTLFYWRREDQAKIKNQQQNINTSFTNNVHKCSPSSTQVQLMLSWRNRNGWAFCPSVAWKNVRASEVLDPNDVSSFFACRQFTARSKHIVSGIRNPIS